MIFLPPIGLPADRRAGLRYLSGKQTSIRYKKTTIKLIEIIFIFKSTNLQIFKSTNLQIFKF